MNLNYFFAQKIRIYLMEIIRISSIYNFFGALGYNLTYSNEWFSSGLKTRAPF